MDFFDAYEELYSAIERFVEENSKSPTRINVSPALFRWILEVKQEAVAHHLEDVSGSTLFNTRFGPAQIVIDELLSPYEIIVE